jgi:hypothetical protein
MAAVWESNKKAAGGTNVHTTQTTEDAVARTALELIHELWADHQHACPYVRHDEHGCFCTSPALPEDADGRMVCDVYSVQLWCLTDVDYTRCCLCPAGDVG